MGLHLLLLLLGLLFSRTGSLLEQPNNCIAAETLCVADPECNATYRILENCSKNKVFLLDHQARRRCLKAEAVIKNTFFQECKCHRHTRKQEEQCLRIYWTVHPSLTPGDFRLEVSPYEGVPNEELSKTKYKKLTTQISGSHIAGDSSNPCLQVTHVCNQDPKCVRLRTLYASICSTGHTCHQHKCHRGLRRFFERVNMNLTKMLLFCPCQDELCGERRRNTIVPECSFQSSIKPNCLLLLDSCLKDNICKSRLADFQDDCKPSSDSCSQSQQAVCLEAYMRMVGTVMTPNYISNSSVDVTLWCSCENSGNQKEDCDQILSSFDSNRCLRSAIQSQMSLNQVNAEYQAELQFTPFLNIQGDGTSTVLTAEMGHEKMPPEISMYNRNTDSNSVNSGVQLSILTLTLTLLLPLLGPL
ncbi:GDNF family receptor alpha-3 isoform X2 [Hemicordylus capensis]|uniref:GDNF family receptor alpha-3 isoform X2 n=1 Tax=Hemicordylus capensis TaxID=884348 RepID=UPI0023048AE7|nr:GDNF family receptor alpha-3 isoform X2 [Hemicordylus capensis]